MIAWPAFGVAWAGLIEPPPKPEPLVRAETARWVLETAHLETCVRQPHPDPNQPPTRRFFTWRCAGNAYLVTHQGNEEGVVIEPWRNSDGTPRQSPTTYDPRHFLYLDDQVWHSAAWERKAQVWPGQTAPSHDLFDWRQVGLNPTALDRSWDAVVRESIEQGAPPPEYSARQEEGLHVVTARALESEVTWWIDPQRHWSVVRTAYTHSGERVLEHRFTLGQFNGHWFPARIEVLSGGESEPRRVWEVLYAEFNLPTHPRQLGPADIGIEPGRPVGVYEKPDAPGQRAYWDGAQLISPEEFVQRRQAGELLSGPALVRQRARDMARIERLVQLAERGLIDPSTLPPHLAARFARERAQVARSFETVWEQYTREFIQRHGLDHDQSQKAWAICRDCQELAREYVARHRETIEKLEKRLAEKAAGPVSQPVADSAVRELAELLRPIEQIFEERLKPRLERLLTREQSQRASQTGATNP
jgi:hypothetical protein